MTVAGHGEIPREAAAHLAALPQTTATVTVGGRHVTDTGVLLETLVTDAGPAYPASLVNTKNELLRVTRVALRLRRGGHLRRHRARELGSPARRPS